MLIFLFILNYLFIFIIWKKEEACLNELVKRKRVAKGFIDLSFERLKIVRFRKVGGRERSLVSKSQIER